MTESAPHSDSDDTRSFGSSGAPRLAFLRMGPHPIPNRLLPVHLARVFPGYEIEVVDVVELVRRHRSVVLANMFVTVALYGWRRPRHWPTRWQAFFTTPYIFREMKRLIGQRLAAGDYRCTFQIQSLFDASQDGIPHFVYTDSTMLANLNNAAFNPRALARRRWIELERTIYDKAAVNFTRSSDISRSLTEQYGVDAARVQRVGAGSNVDVDHTRTRNGDWSNKNILFVGVDWKRKGGPHLAAAFREVLKSHPDATLTIVGCNPSLELDGCRVVGKCSLEEVGRYYEQASVFCLPTLVEPFGVALVEAMHHALPIVATNISAIPDLVRDGENGFLVEPGDVGGLARQLTRLIGDPGLCREFGERGQQRARSDYTWNSVAAKMEAAIRPHIR